MHVGKKFGLFEALMWTRRSILKFIIVAVIPTTLYQLLGWHWLGIPWLPIALIGTAVAFIVGFKNNASYDRLWEARKIWGGIVNTSRTFGIMTRDFISNRHAGKSLNKAQRYEITKVLIYRHLAWVTALRHQLRAPKPWENMDSVQNREYKNYYAIPEHSSSLNDDLKPFLTNEEIEEVLTHKNIATQLISKQSKEFKKLMKKGLIEDFRHMELENLLKELYEHQGKCERIKNFPYPRQFATLNVYFVWLFLILVPFGMLHEFDKLGEHMVWLTIPFSTLVSWVFNTMESIGEVSENPFQGGANDIPMHSLTRTIEIDLREMLGEKDLPEPVQAQNNILM